MVKEAQERFERTARYYHNARKNWIEDLKFDCADSINQYQWPNAIRRSRDVDERPCLTINKTRQHNLNIINEAKKQPPGIKISATGNGATFEAAQVYMAWARHIEYKSDAPTAYNTATGFQVRSGMGYIRVGTEYCKPDSFDQDLRIYRHWDPLNIYLDPDAKEADKSDMNFAFVFDDLQKDEFKATYPELAKKYGADLPQNTIDDASGWIREDYVRVAEYFRRVSKPDRIAEVRGTVLRRSDFGDDAQWAEIEAMADGRVRDTAFIVVEWYFIVGDEVAEKSVWPGTTIPIVPVVGEEYVIEGQYDCKGHTRAMLDSQRMLNYWASTAVEYGALQSKSPYIGSAESIEGYETLWNTANRINHSVLLYNALADDGSTPLAPPQRQEPPVAAPVAITGMQIAQNELMLVSGQYADMMGDKSNERSAEAIGKRQKQGDTSTYHFIDNLAIAVRRVGKIFLEVAPKIYTTQRVMLIQGEDGKDFELEINPQATAAFEKHQAHDAQTIQRIMLNPTVGEYEVQADVGPGYGTKREDTFQALALILTQAPQLTAIIGDLLLRSSDFHLADEAAARLRRMVPPQALGDGPSQTEMQLTQQVATLTDLLRKSMEESARDKLKIKSQDARRSVDVFKAFTDRLKVFLDAKSQAAQAAVDPQDIKALIDEALDEALGLTLDPVREAVEPSLEMTHGGQLELPVRANSGMEMT